VEPDLQCGRLAKPPRRRNLDAEGGLHLVPGRQRQEDGQGEEHGEHDPEAGVRAATLVVAGDARTAARALP